MNRIKRIDEMGVELNRIPQSYLGKAAQQSSKVKDQNKLVRDMVEMLTNLTWQEIEFDSESNGSGGKVHKVKLPQPIIDKFKAYRQAYPDGGGVDIGSWVQLGDSYAINMETESPASFQRSHFPGNGIPVPFRGTGLGYKLYRKLLEVNGYLRSDTAGTAIKNNAWASLIKKRPDPDDVHAIVGPASVFALTKTLPVREKIDITEKYLASSHINLDEINNQNFAIDDELKAVLPAELQAAIGNPEARAALTRAREEMVRRTREAELRQQAERNRDLHTAFGIAEIDTNWQVGDFVVRYTMINDASAKIRIVVNFDGIKAISVGDFIRLSMTGSLDRNAVARTPDRTEWTKIDITTIPNLDNVRLSQAEKAFVRSIIAKGEKTAPDPRNAAVPVTARSTEYGPLNRAHDTAEWKRLIETRMLNTAASRKIMQGNFVSKILLSPAQEERFTSGLCTEVFVPFDGLLANMRAPQQHSIGEKAVNTISGYTYMNPSDDKFTVKTLREVRGKRDVRIGEMVYIANHPIYYGLTAKVSMTIRNEAGAEYAMLTILNPNLGGEFRRKVSIPLSMLKKIV